MSGVGIFDSGFGGLTVVRQFIKLFPDTALFYFGDTARVPYGEKTKEQIIGFNEEIISFLIKQGAGVILMGCNTSSSLAIDHDRTVFKVPIFGLIEPTAQAIGAATKNKKIGVLATPATVSSKAYTQKIQKYLPGAEVFEVACPKLVPLIEAGILKGPEIEAAVAEYLAPILKAGADTVIYGCTHYPFLKTILKNQTHGRVVFVDPAYFICQEAAPAVKKLPARKLAVRKYFTTGSLDKFRKMSQILMSDIIKEDEISAVSLDELKG